MFVDLTRFWTWHHAVPGTAFGSFLHPNDHPHDAQTSSKSDEIGRIVAFHAYPRPSEARLPNLVNAALYVVRREGLRAWSQTQGPLDFAKDLFPRMLVAGAVLRGCHHSPDISKTRAPPNGCNAFATR